MLFVAHSTIHALAGLIIMLGLITGSVVVLSCAVASAKRESDAHYDAIRRYPTEAPVPVIDPTWDGHTMEQLVPTETEAERTWRESWEHDLATGYRRVRGSGYASPFGAPSTVESAPVRTWEV